jgi:DNA-binding protein HU-beta
LNKKELINKISEKVDIQKKDVQEVVEICFHEIINAIKAEKKVTIVGFGNFELKHRKSREGRSPVNHQKILIPASNYVGFKAGSILKKTIKDNDE